MARRVRLRTGGTVRVQETGDGPPVLLVHGAVNAGTSWMALMAKLPDFRCIALDRPGSDVDVPPQLASGCRSCSVGPMARMSIEIDSFRHENPIPAATRIGPLIESGIIPAFNDGVRQMPDTLDEMVANLFLHMGNMLTAGGATWDDMVKIRAHREAEIARCKGAASIPGSYLRMEEVQERILDDATRKHFTEMCGQGPWQQHK